MIGGDKRGSWNRWYEQMVPVADDLYDEHPKAYKDLRDKVRSSPERAARVKTRRQAMEDALALSEIREKRELTQTDIAEVLEMSQANVSRIERQQNLYLSTLAEYVEALGGELKISAVFADEEVEISVGRELSSRR